MKPSSNRAAGARVKANLDSKAGAPLRLAGSPGANSQSLTEGSGAFFEADLQMQILSERQRTSGSNNGPLIQVGLLLFKIPHFAVKVDLRHTMTPCFQKCSKSPREFVRSKYLFCHSEESSLVFFPPRGLIDFHSLQFCGHPSLAA